LVMLDSSRRGTLPDATAFEAETAASRPEKSAGTA
jgi:hypothetical protein